MTDAEIVISRFGHYAKLASMLDNIPGGLVHLPSANMEKAGFIIYTAASHQGAIKMLAVIL